MIIKSLTVKNFRSILDETVCFDKLTALVGANGSGKSSFLHSLELFQAKQPKITLDDFYNKNTENEIIISITFTKLSDDAKTQFSKYLQEDELTVCRVFKLVDDKLDTAYYGSIVQNSNFSKIRSFKATDAQLEYKKLRQKTGYNTLPEWKNHIQAKDNLDQWERKHPEQCERIRDDGKFFGFSNVGSGYLARYIKLLYIPAVRDAALDATEGRNSALADLINIVIRNELMQKNEIQKFQEEFTERYKEILVGDIKREISTLSDSLSKTLNIYAPNTKVDLSWETLESFEIPQPSAIAKLIEDEYSAPVDRTGHGLQRIFIMTLLQHLATTRERVREDTSVVDLSTLVLIIEEPELYQHPNSQRHISEIFLDLSGCNISGMTPKVQIVYSTHSPHFVGLDRIDQIRLLKKVKHNDIRPKITKISSTSITKLVNELSKYHAKKFTEHNILPRLHRIRTPWINEGFFSKCVVLVEGDSDRAAILGTAKALNINLEGKGISIIPCSGKGNLDHVTIIFKQLDIPTYTIWDNDRGNTDEIAKNKLLLKLFNEEESDYPCHVKDNHACIEGNLETMLKNEIGDAKYQEILDINKTEYDLNESDAIKNPTVIKTMLEDIIKSDGKIPDTLNDILKKIQKLNRS